MRKIIALALLGFALVAGTATVMTIHPQQAVADGGSGSCSGC